MIPTTPTPICLPQWKVCDISLAFVWIFMCLVIVGVPILFMLLLAPAASLVIDGREQLCLQIVSRLFSSMFSFPLMAIPLFTLVGELMNLGGTTLRIMRFSQALIGRVRGCQSRCQPSHLA